MKTFQVWLVLEETDDDSPKEQIETYQVSVCKTEQDGRETFGAAQDILFNHKSNLEDNILNLVGAVDYQDFMDWLESKWMDVFANKETETSISDLGYSNVKECVDEFKQRK